MGIKGFKPTSPGIRTMTVHTFEEITKDSPERSLVERLKKNAGRNVYGRVTMRHQGGGVRRKYRIIDFKRDKHDGVPAKVAAIEYDPNRTCRIALLHYANGAKSYVLAPEGVKVGDTLYSGAQSDIKVGNTLPLSAIPVGTVVHNIELVPGRGGQMVRAAGASAQIMARENGWCLVGARRSEPRLVGDAGRATIGFVANHDPDNIVMGPAARSRHMGIRPTVRGVVMNPVDHPHGGGEGKSPIGRPSPVTPWGKPTLGYKTRKKSKASDKYIVKRRTK